jgi:hypothetical protein
MIEWSYKRNEEFHVINEIIRTLPGVDKAMANQILEKLWAQGIDLSECTQRAFKMAVMEAAASL